MSIRNMEVQYIGDTLYLPPLEREVSRIIVREYDLRDWEYFKPMWAGCDNCAALNRAAGLWAKADKRVRELERTCKVIEMHEHVTMDEPDIAELSCGHDIMVFDMEPPNYCPNCGARVTPKNSETTQKMVSE